MSKSSFTFYISLLLIFIFVTPVVGQTRFAKLGIGVEGSFQQILGAGSVNASPGFGGGINMSLSLMEGLSFRSRFAVNQLSWKIDTKDVTTDLMTISGYFSGDLMPNSNFNIFPFFGIGIVFYDPKDEASGGRPAYVSSFDTQFGGGIGFEYFPNEFLSVTLMPEYVMTGSRYFNGPVEAGNDSYMRVAVQVRYYFFDQSFITKLLENLRTRMKHK